MSVVEDLEAKWRAEVLPQAPTTLVGEAKRQHAQRILELVKLLWKEINTPPLEPGVVLTFEPGDWYWGTACKIAGVDQATTRQISIEPDPYKAPWAWQVCVSSINSGGVERYVETDAVYEAFIRASAPVD